MGNFFFSFHNLYFQNSFYKIYYPITLKDNSLFKKAVYHNDFELMSHIRYSLYYQRKKDDKKGYFVLTSDSKYINYAFLEKKDGYLYTKYNPLNEYNSGTVMKIKILFFIFKSMI